MCGRYAVFLPAEAMAKLAGVFAKQNIRPRWNAAPTDELPVVRFNPDTRARQVDLLRWGLVPLWAKDLKFGTRTINARAETVQTASAFKDAFAKRRCLVPASAFYEWQKLAKGRKQPYAIAMLDGEPFAFAGLWERWRSPEGEIVRTFSIITGEPNALVAPLHDRMPVILQPADYGAWLGETDAGADALQALLRPYPAERMRAWPVDPRVGKVSEDDPGLIKPVESEAE